MWRCTKIDKYEVCQDGGADLTIMMRREAYGASRLQVKAGHKTIACDEAQSYTDADVK